MYIHVNFVLNGRCMGFVGIVYNVVFIIGHNLRKLLLSKGPFIHDVSIYDDQTFSCILPSFQLPL